MRGLPRHWIAIRLSAKFTIVCGHVTILSRTDPVLEVPMTEKPPEKSRMLLSMVALDTPSLPVPQEMLETLASLSGTTVNAEAVEARRAALAFPLGGNTAAVALMPAPIPWSNLEGPCETAWWWPEAGERMRGHNSHLLVALGGESGDAVRRSLALTHLTAAVAAHVDAAGIYWGGGRLVHDPQVFLEEARSASPENLPLHLWIDFRIEPNDDGTLRLFTTGMKALDKMEIEIPHSRHEASGALRLRLLDCRLHPFSRRGDSRRPHRRPPRGRKSSGRACALDVGQHR